MEDLSVERVDKFGEQLRDQLQDIGRGAVWGAEFDLSKPAGSDYYRAKVIIQGKPIDKNWIQLNGHTYYHPSYSSQGIPWKIQVRLSSNPASPLPWERKVPYEKNENPHERSISGIDVFAISYDKLYEALLNEGENSVMDEILEDLHVSWAYANGQQPPQDLANTNSEQSAGRVDITFSIDERIWSEFRAIVHQQYRPRRKHPKGPSYAKLLEDAVDSALMSYVNQWKGLCEGEDRASEE